MLKALYSSLEFYAKKFVEYGLRKTSFSSLEFYVKKKVRKWRRRALPYGLVMKCLRRYASFVLVTIACAFSCKLERECRYRSLRRPRNKPQRLVRPKKPVRWRWKKRKFGLAEVQSRIGLERSTLNKFCSYDHDFLALPRLLKSLSDKELHEKNISSCLSRVAVLRGVFDFNHSGSPIDPKTMVLIWDTDASAGLTSFRSDFIDYVKVDFGNWGRYQGQQSRRNWHYIAQVRRR